MSLPIATRTFLSDLPNFYEVLCPKNPSKNRDLDGPRCVSPGGIYSSLGAQNPVEIWETVQKQRIKNVSLTGPGAFVPKLHLLEFLGHNKTS